MIEPNNSILSIGQQCRLLSISRSSFYYTPSRQITTHTKRATPPTAQNTHRFI